MAETIWALLELNRNAEDLGAGAMALRTIVIYVFTLAIVRLGSRRLLSKPSAFDVIVAIMVGSIMRPSCHWLLASLALRMHWISATVKGTRIPLIRKGHGAARGDAQGEHHRRRPRRGAAAADPRRRSLQGRGRLYGAQRPDQRHPAANLTLGEASDHHASRGQEFGVVGLGRIGAGIAHHAIEQGMRVVGTSRSGAPRELVAAGLTEITGVSGFRAQLRPPRAVLLYIPAGPAVDAMLDELERPWSRAT